MILNQVFLVLIIILAKYSKWGTIHIWGWPNWLDGGTVGSGMGRRSANNTHAAGCCEERNGTHSNYHRHTIWGLLSTCYGPGTQLALCPHLLIKPSSLLCGEDTGSFTDWETRSGQLTCCTTEWQNGDSNPGLPSSKVSVLHHYSLPQCSVSFFFILPFLAE